MLHIEHFRCRARLDVEKKQSENFERQNKTRREITKSHECTHYIRRKIQKMQNVMITFYQIRPANECTYYIPWKLRKRANVVITFYENRQNGKMYSLHCAKSVQQTQYTIYSAGNFKFPRNTWCTKQQTTKISKIHFVLIKKLQKSTNYILYFAENAQSEGNTFCNLLKMQRPAKLHL